MNLNEFRGCRLFIPFGCLSECAVVGRVFDSPFFTQGVQQLHHFQSFFMRHIRGLNLTITDSLHTSFYLVFETGNLFGTVIAGHFCMVFVVATAS